MSKLVPLQAGRGYAIVDDEDYPLVKDSKWYWVDGYAARVIRVDAKRTWELMHRLIAQPPPDMDTDGQHARPKPRAGQKAPSSRA